MENEIYDNNDNNEKIVNAQENNSVEQKKCEQKETFDAKAMFSVAYLPYVFVVISMFMVMLNKFILALALNTVVYAIFFFISFGLGLTAFIISLLNRLKSKEEKINLAIILSLFAMLISLF